MGDLFKVLFLIGLAVAEMTRLPTRWRRRGRKVEDNRLTGLEWVLLLCILVGLWVLPLTYILTPWLRFADYRLPMGAGWVGVVLLGVSLWLRWRALADLGRNWSSTLVVIDGHALVTEGIYRFVRHPIYLAVWLSVVAQALMLHNWIAGWSGLVLFLPVYWLRVPREEQMMLEHFGEAYRAYMGRTGRIVPRLRP
jgi:protein-S-isoprenylcysteine O-methyltransferase Ste14